MSNKPTNPTILIAYYINSNETKLCQQTVSGGKRMTGSMTKGSILLLLVLTPRRNKGPLTPVLRTHLQQSSLHISCQSLLNAIWLGFMLSLTW